MQEIQNLIQQKGLKATAQRIMVYQVLKNLHHATAENIARDVRLIVPSITVSTVYLILESFANVGLIRRLDSIAGKITYDISSDSHPHLVDEKSLRIEDYKDEKLCAIISQYIKENNIPGFSLKDVLISLAGTFD